jgi:hypothetical protein
MELLLILHKTDLKLRSHAQKNSGQVSLILERGEKRKLKMKKIFTTKTQRKKNVKL